VQGLSAVQHSQFCSPGWQLDVVFLVVVAVVGFAFVVAIGFAFVAGPGAEVVVVQAQVLVRPHDSSVK